MKLSDLADVISGFAFDSKWFGKGIKKVIRISDLVGGSINLVNATTFDHVANPISEQFIAKSRDVLIALSGATTGKIGVVTDKEEGAYVNQRVAIVRGKSQEAKDWLPYLLMSDVTKQLVLTAGGAAQSNLSINDLKDLRIPDLLATQQSKIANNLKTQLAEVETARQALEIQQQEIIKLANAYIRESIEHSDVSECLLGDVLDEVKKGIGEHWADYPVLGATRDGLAPAKEPPGKQPQRYKPVFSGTVFYNPMRILIGSIAFVDDDDQPGITSPDYVALQGKPGIVDSRWFYYWLRSPFGVQCINSLARGAVRERMLFNRLAEGFIQLPPYSEQVRISAALKQLQPVKAAIKQQLDDLNKIPERLLAKAFDFNHERRSS